MDEKTKVPAEPPERRGFSWALLVALLVVTLVAALVIAYLITMHNFPAR